MPIYVQVRDQILRALGEGRLKPGDRMPTMRQVAVALRIDLNTARRAYDELGADVRGRLLAGLFVPATAYLTALRVRTVIAEGFRRACDEHRLD